MSDFEELVRVFRNEATERLEELVGILSTGDNSEALRSAKAAAHNLKGAALTVGVQIIAGPCAVFEEEFQTALNAGTLPGKVELDTWVQILSELKDIIGNPTLLPLDFRGLAELDEGTQEETEYVHVSHPSGDPSELVASNAPPVTVQIESTRLDAIRGCLDELRAVQVTFAERNAALKSQIDGNLQPECTRVGRDENGLNSALLQLTESGHSLDVLLDELRTLFDQACNAGRRR